MVPALADGAYLAPAPALGRLSHFSRRRALSRGLSGPCRTYPARWRNVQRNRNLSAPPCRRRWVVQSAPPPNLKKMHTEPISESAMAREDPGGDPPELGSEIFDCAGEAHADAESLEQTLRSLLAVYPAVPVGAMTSAGIYVPMPESIPLGDHQVLEGRSGLDLIGTEDREAVLQNWDRALNFGASRCSIHPEG